MLADILNTLTQSGVTVIMVSHDIEFCAKYPHRCMMFFGGDIVSQATPRKFFASNSFYVTSANRISRSIIENAVTAEDVIYCCTGKKEQKPPSNHTDLYDYGSEEFTKTQKREIQKLPLWKKLLGVFSSIAFVFALIINLDYLPNLNSKVLPMWADFLIVAVPVALLMVSFGSKSKRPLDEVRADRRKRKIPKRTIAAACSSADDFYRGYVP